MPGCSPIAQAQALQRGSGMPNNYTLTKHLAERLLDDLCAQGGYIHHTSSASHSLLAVLW